MRKRLGLVLFAVALVVSLTGCGVAFRNAADEFVRTQPESAWGNPPPSGHKDAERSKILSMLKDPDSATFQFLPVKRVVVSATMTDPTVVPVWESEVLVNAKNSFGGYTGAKTWNFRYRNGVLFSWQDSSGMRYYMK